MYALEFIKYLKKMCAQLCVANFQFASCDPNKAVEAVEKYAKENPIKTRSSEFLKHYPNAYVDCHGMTDICPKVVNKDYTPINGCSKTPCDECRYEYWMQEVE